MQDCSISIAKALEILQSCTEPPAWCMIFIITHFQVSRQLGDFEKLQKSMAAAFPGTVLPTLPKRGVPIVGSANNTARRMGLQDFLSAIASVPKMATSAPLLEFLGRCSQTSLQHDNFSSKYSQNTLYNRPCLCEFINCSIFCISMV